MFRRVSRLAFSSRISGAATLPEMSDYKELGTVEGKVIVLTFVELGKAAGKFEKFYCLYRCLTYDL